MKRFIFTECHHRRGELSAFESGELTPERAERVAAHLAVCFRCRSEWETISGVATLLRAESPVPSLPPADLWSRIESEILEPVPAPAPVPAWRRPAFALSVSGAAMAAVTIAVVPKLLPSSSEATPALRFAVEASAPAPTASPVAVATIERVEADAPPVIYAAPTPEPTPRPALNRKPSSPRRSRPSGRIDPFEPVAVTSHGRRRPPRRAAPPPVIAIVQPTENTSSTPEVVPVVAPTPAALAPDVVAKSAEGDPRETVIPVTKPAPSKTALRDVRTEGESAERRSEAAMESPLDAVERASRARRLFP